MPMWQRPRATPCREGEEYSGRKGWRCHGEAVPGIPAIYRVCREESVRRCSGGEICSSPTAAAFLDAFREADQGKGVACLTRNYSGDNMNVKMAVRMAKKEGITVKTVAANDDVASAPKDQMEKRRGVAGEVLMWKAGRRKGSVRRSLDEVVRRQ